MNKYLLILLVVFQYSPLLATDQLPWLNCRGKHIVDERKHPVVLKGINLGGWLTEEMWLLPIKCEPPKHSNLPKINDHVSLWNTLSMRFGAEKMQQIRTQFRLHWITDADFARIKALGFNSVRLPFLYDISEEKEGLFVWLDRAIDSAKRHGLYVILDMHGVSGRQSNEDHTGQAKQNKFFSDPVHIQKTAKLWAQIADRYKHCSHVAGYDLINEPMGTPSVKVLFSAYHEIYKAIRKKDPGHIIFVQDGFKGVKKMPSPKKYGWKNVALSTHRYTHDAKSAKDQIQNFHAHTAKVSKHRSQHLTPFYLGEFNVVPHGTAETVKLILKNLKKEKLSFALWTYKIGKSHTGLIPWGLFYTSKWQKAIDPYNDSFRDIVKKIEHIKTEYCSENNALMTVFRQHNYH